MGHFEAEDALHSLSRVHTAAGFDWKNHNLEIRRKCLPWQESVLFCVILNWSPFSPWLYEDQEYPGSFSLKSFGLWCIWPIPCVGNFMSCWRVHSSKVLGYRHSELLSCLSCTLCLVFLMALFYCCSKQFFASVSLLLVHSVACLWLRVIEGSTCPRRPLLRHLTSPPSTCTRVCTFKHHL